MRARCLDCRGWAVAGKSRCAEHSARQESVWNAGRRALRRERLANGDNAQARVRAALRKAGEGTCVHCCSVFPAAALEVDHVVPLFRGGLDVMSNIQLLCKPHHQAKTNNDRRNSPR
ncbi:HNH endonuclease [Streptomyces hirsutus]|uniref:HNH endonuclease n=1 Tax=Streptomyces hirsutus TaxID=35620 RepID=UPI0033BC103C